MSVPDDLNYTSEHEWQRVEGDIATIGITEYAAGKLGDVVFVDLVAVGSKVSQGGMLGEIESTKSVGELFAPRRGTVVAVNDAVISSPELVNSDPYGDGWLVKVRVSAEDNAAGITLLTADEYQAFIDG